jgi:hypothetical protein
VTLNWGLGRTLEVGLDRATTFEFQKVYWGTGTTMRLHVYHQGGPWPMRFPASVRWPTGGAPGASTADRIDMFEFVSNGTIVYGRVLGLGY